MFCHYEYHGIEVPFQDTRDEEMQGWTGQGTSQSAPLDPATRPAKAGALKSAFLLRRC